MSAIIDTDYQTQWDRVHKTTQFPEIYLFNNTVLTIDRPKKYKHMWHSYVFMYITTIFITLLLESKPISVLAIQTLFISRVKCIGYRGKEVLNSHLGSNSDPRPCYNEPCYKEIQVYSVNYLYQLSVHILQIVSVK